MFELTEEQLMIQNTVRKIATEKIMPRAQEIDHADEFPMDIAEVLYENNILGMAMPEEYGGIQADALTMSLVIEEAARGLTCIGPMLLSTNSVIRTIDIMGTEEQKHRFFSRLNEGPKLGAFCLTEPNAGSDAHSLKTYAKKVEGGYVLNGQKCFITLAIVADLYLVFAKTNQDREISCFVVEKETEGLSFGKVEKKMGLHGSITADMFLENAFVPEENRLGKEGDGWYILNFVVNSMRAWGAASFALGNAQAALDYAVQYAKQREQFGKPIIEFQAIQFMIADMAILIEAARCLVRMTNARVDLEGGKITRETLAMVAKAKCFAADVGMKVTTDAVQICGGNGYMQEYPVERMMRDAKAIQILDGSNEIQRFIIGRNLAKN
ncbi:Acyl-CoA dehydrogenase [Desulfotomaculum arcticum]|uniref:Acyl-CoA dehydrogenase n=1 Tax=Desulfotruncus arcticus DSM 17038 TaxID=1121424 RepID=A0A1I2XUP6_9FIRM|nr:acyl-CoA dehydrogenase family protein [Desulfotruncus arcticus]SFH17204.1 Acyl-CoA dehydrogenase [Desulfotomaculum arcticum] [Desulfotruncus arcticus DSM 17038]